MKKIPLHKRDGTIKYALVDDADFDELNKYRWCHAVQNEKRNSGRREVAMRRENGKTIYMSVQIMNPQKGMKVDHFPDANPLNNQRGNLRVCTNAQNLLNRGKTKSNTSGFKGVTKVGNKFVTYATIDCKTEYLGTYPTAKEAAVAYDVRLYARDPEFAVLNFPKNNYKLK